jgi:hypothetical protein
MGRIGVASARRESGSTNGSGLAAGWLKPLKVLSRAGLTNRPSAP